MQLKNLTPREIVAELDRYVVGQRAAKRAVAIALRNRWRRQKVVPELRDEILPKNIILIGPTGVGKTEIARRLALAKGLDDAQARRLADACGGEQAIPAAVTQRAEALAEALERLAARG